MTIKLIHLNIIVKRASKLMLKILKREPFSDNQSKTNKQTNKTQYKNGNVTINVQYVIRHFLALRFDNGNTMVQYNTLNKGP